MPLWSLDFRDEGTEIAAVFALLEEVSVEGRARITVRFVTFSLTSSPYVLF